jgi:plastocyanin
VALAVVLAACVVAARSWKGRSVTAANTVTVNMVGTSSGYKFDPASVTIKAGDTVKWVVVSGAPHNISFDEKDLPAGAVAGLDKAMANTQAKLTGPLMTANGATYSISFAGLPTGAYKYFCLPHQSVGMLGVIIVE